jgi:hypothetical protein
MGAPPGLGRPAGAAGAGAGNLGCGPRDAGGALRVHRGQAGLLKYACAISDDRFRIQEQKSAVATATVARDPEPKSHVRALSRCKMSDAPADGLSPIRYPAIRSWPAGNT